VTDSQGRYLIVAPPGEYRLEVSKQDYGNFSEHLKNQTEDTKYPNLYHGGVIKVTEPALLAYNIPMDPNLEDKPTKIIIKEHLIKYVHYLIALSGLIITTIVFIITPNPTIASFFFLHLIFFALFYRFSRTPLPSAYGIVSDLKDEKPLGQTVIRVFDNTYNKLVASSVTDHKGRYSILVGPSVFFVNYDKDGYNSKNSPPLDLSSERTGGIGGVIDRSERLERKS